ncbi:MAG: hypothetical protein Q4G52_07460 [Clostridia bacterium]|nr:hypothetical protein [Clostridia bacterium]
MAEYEQMRSELELLRALADADEDVRAGRVAPKSNHAAAVYYIAFGKKRLNHTRSVKILLS